MFNSGVPILNHREYRSAKAQIAQLLEALGPAGVIGDITAHLPADVAAARQQALKSELQRLEAEVATYEKLRGEQLHPQAEFDLGDLGLLPIIARIARRLSQRELAERLQIKEQQIQRYESERYVGIGLARYQNILDVLGVELQPRLLPWTAEEAAPKAENDLGLPPDLLREIRKRNWIDIPSGTGSHEAATIISAYVQEAVSFSKSRPFHRRSLSQSAESGDTALTLWRARILKVAADQRARMKTKFNIRDTSWLKTLVTMSVYPDGPIRAADLLREKGILLVVEPQLPHTLLDGAALLLLESTPIVGLTLRHDRLDNFWFTLLHELGHIFLHFSRGLDAGFIDDLDEISTEKTETEADSFARSNLLPDEAWNSSPARFSKSADLIRSFAESRSIHPAIVAGRIRRERNNYRIFDELVGRGQVRRLLHQSV